MPLDVCHGEDWPPPHLVVPIERRRLGRLVQPSLTVNCSNLRHLPSVAGLKSEDGLKDTRKAFLWGSYGEPDGVPLVRNVPNRRCHAYRKASITIRSNMRSERRRRRKSSGRAAKPPV